MNNPADKSTMENTNKNEISAQEVSSVLGSLLDGYKREDPNSGIARMAARMAARAKADPTIVRGDSFGDIANPGA